MDCLQEELEAARNRISELSEKLGDAEEEADALKLQQLEGQKSAAAGAANEGRKVSQYPSMDAWHPLLCQAVSRELILDTSFF